MKKFFLSVIILFAGIFGHTQNRFIGDWGGILKGAGLHIVMHISEKAGRLMTTMDSPDQGAKGIPCDSTSMSDSIIIITLKAAGMQYTGRLSADGKTITGIFSQRGYNIDLALEKNSAGNANINANSVKPQTPTPPYPYNADSVEYDNADKTIHYGATLTYPKGNGKFPVLIMITGSGLQDRDETIGQHKPFAVIADYLSRNGIAVLRIDDRTKGKTTGNIKNVTTKDFAKDIEVAIGYIKTRKEIDTKRIGLIGHSEGAIIAPMIAAENKGVAFVVMLAAPAVGGKKTNEYQNMIALKANGVSQEGIDAYLRLHDPLLDKVATAKDTAAFTAGVAGVYHTWKMHEKAGTVALLFNGTDEENIDELKKKFLVFMDPWWKFFLRYDPLKDIATLKCPVLALNGEKDHQVESKTNLAAIHTTLQKGGNKYFTTEEIPGVNHLFQTCNTCSFNEYFDLDETFSPKTLDAINKWLHETLNKKLPAQ